ncbi:MAG: zinc ABC transporter substrate-binding protein [Desulfobacterota bacterium]|nr:zinc ABC transporter substrate-binding protein [Thermodesulfobacteriota bacterium]MDW8001681.1 zinc ABC transporter substrate-binding protein [Deltaproteobacteria bacterium]
MRKILCVGLILLIFVDTSFGKTRIVASIFPFYDFTRQVVKERADVHLLVGADVDPHHFEPKPSDFLEIRRADFFVYGGSEIEPWAAKIIKGIISERPYIVPLGEGLDLAYSGKGVKDPHVWLDLTYVERMVVTLMESLSQKDPGNGDFYRKNGKLYIEKIRQLDRKFERTLSSCKVKTIVHAGHYSFGYLAKRYGLGYFAAYPPHMESDVQPKKVWKMKDILKKNRAKFVFYEESKNRKLAEKLAKELGIEILPLNPGHSVSKKDLEGGITFEKIMENNLQSLRKGLECNP